MQLLLSEIKKKQTADFDKRFNQYYHLSLRSAVVFLGGFFFRSFRKIEIFAGAFLETSFRILKVAIW